MPPKKQPEQKKKTPKTVEDKVCLPIVDYGCFEEDWQFFSRQTFGMKNVCADPIPPATDPNQPEY